MKRIYYVTPLILQSLIWIPIRFLFWLFIRFEVRGLEHLEKISEKKGIIFASNHTSELDPIILPAGLPFLSRFMPIFYTSREKSFYIKSGYRQNIYGGVIFKLWGAHAVYSGLKDYEKSLVNHIKLLNAGKSLMIFPEGRISKDGQIGEARGGVAFLSEITNCPIVPIHITGAYQITLKEILTRKRKVTLTFGESITIKKKEKAIETYKEIAEMIMRKVEVLK